MSTLTVARRAVAATALGLASILAIPLSAAAAGELELSDDGVTYASSLGGPLFTAVPVLVPGQSASTVFYIRNASSDAAYLRITLDSSSASSSSLASALTLSTSVPGLPGVPVVVGSSGACKVLLTGWVLQPGDSVAVTTTLGLDDLGGTTAQNETAGLSLGVTLFQAVGPSPTGCGTPSAVIPVVRRPAAAKPPTPTPSASPTPTPVPTEESHNPLESFPAFFNTVASDGSLVIYSSLAAGVGAAGYFFLPVIRRRRYDQLAEGDPS